ncbi:MAG: hypothetical protein IH991_04610 [Planctomycetes bacterium]|nr:hypothetical protein [Planctomycetota bacterium]
MAELTTTELLILNAASDDFENLEQLYRSLSLQFSAENYDPTNPQSFYWREATHAPQLCELANAIIKLVEQGSLEGKSEDGKIINHICDASLVWQGWFRTTQSGLDVIGSDVDPAPPA